MLLLLQQKQIGFGLQKDQSESLKDENLTKWGDEMDFKC